MRERKKEYLDKRKTITEYRSSMRYTIEEDYYMQQAYLQYQADHQNQPNIDDMTYEELLEMEE